MLPEIKHYPVNWIDGMKISRKHFTETDQSIHEHLRDAIALSLNVSNFGLLPADAYGLSSFDINLNVDQNQGIHVRLSNCRAVTAGGCRIEIIRHDKLTYRTTLNDLLEEYNLAPVNQMRFNVVVSVNPFVRVPMGQPAPEEVPPRHPYTIPEYKLNIVPSRDLNTADFSSFHLVIGELVYEDGVIRQSANYIPPSTALLSHPALLSWLNTFSQLLQDIETDAFKIINKIKTRQDKKSMLSELVHFLVEKTVFALAAHVTSLHLTAAQQPPIALIDTLMRLAKQVKTSLDCLTSQEREELLKYFEQWSEISPATLLNALQGAVTMPYDHLRTAEHFGQMHDLYLLIAAIFRQLSQLEYIGKTKEGWKTFINENPIEAPVEKRISRWSPLR